MAEVTKSSVIQSLQIGLDLLDILANEKEPMKFTDIQKVTSMSKSNLHKYLATLCMHGAVYRNPETNTYSLEPKLIRLGNVALSQSSLIETAIPFFKKINENTNLTALLAIPTPNGPLVSYILSAHYGINIGAQIGTTLPLNSSTGIVFSSFKKAEPMKEWEEKEYEKYDEGELKKIQKQQEQTRKTLFASKVEPLVKHVSSFSVPIFNYKRDLIGAITVVGHTETVPKSCDDPVSKYVLNVAHEISEFYGYYN